MYDGYRYIYNGIEVHMKYSISLNFQHQWKKGDYSANLIRKEMFHTKKLGFFYLKDDFVFGSKPKRKTKKEPIHSVGVDLIWAKFWVGLRKK